MRLVLRSGGKIENRDPFKRSLTGLAVQVVADRDIPRFRAKELITLGAVARALQRAAHARRMSDSD